MRDDDRLLNLPDAEFGSGVIGVCDICGTRQAVIVLSKERFKLCVIDFLNKTWIKTEKKPGVPAPLYRSDRIWYETGAVPSGRAQAIVLSPTKPIKHPVVLVTPDVYGITTTLLDAAIRFARDGYEVLIPDVFKTDGIGPGHHVAMRSGVQFRGGVAVESPRVAQLLHLYVDALGHLRGREMVDPTKTAVFGSSYGGSLALGVAAQDTRLAAVALAYPMPVRPADLPKLVSAPLLFVGGSRDRAAEKTRVQLSAVAGPRAPFEFFEVPGARHNFLARDLSGYEVGPAEAAWTRILAFLKRNLLPPPPKPPAIPPKLVAPSAAATSPPSPPSAGAPAARVPAPPVATGPTASAG